MQTTGTMQPAAFAALPAHEKFNAWRTNDASRLPNDFVGESAEEVAKYGLEAMKFGGFEPLRAVFRKFPLAKLGIKVGSIELTNEIMDWVLTAVPFDKSVKDKFNLIGRNVLQAMIAVLVDTSDPDKHEGAVDQAIHAGQTEEYKRKVSTVDPDRAMIVLMTDPGTGIRMIHPAAAENGTYKDIQNSGTTPVPATTCKHCEGRYNLHAATFRKETSTTGGGKAGGTGGTKTTEPPAFRDAERMLLSEARRLSNVQYCPDEWPAGRPAEPKPAEKADPWYKQIGDEGRLLYDALILFPTTTVTKIDDIVGGQIAKYAAKMEPAEWEQIGKDIKANAGLYDGCWQTKVDANPTATPPVEAKAEGLTQKGFDLVVRRINGRVSDANITTAQKAEVAALTAVDEAKKALKKGGLLGYAAAAGAMGLTVAYVLSAVPIVVLYGLGWFAPETYTLSNGGVSSGWLIGLAAAAVLASFGNSAQWTHARLKGSVGVWAKRQLGWLSPVLTAAAASALVWWMIPVGTYDLASKSKATQSYQIFGASLLGIVWLLAWYTMDGIGKFFGGLIRSKPVDDHDHPGLADTARNISALQCGFGTFLILWKVIENWQATGQWLVSCLFAAGFLATLSYDRLTAVWNKDGHGEESIAHDVIRFARSKMSTLNLVGSGVIALAITLALWMNGADTGTRFRAVTEMKVVGRLEVYDIPTPDGRFIRATDALGRSWTPRVGPVCLPAGSEFDLPGFVEKEVADEDCGDKVGYAIRGRLFGWGMPGERRATVYDTPEEIAAEDARVAQIDHSRESKPADAPKGDAKPVNTEKTREDIPAPRTTGPAIVDNADDEPATPTRVVSEAERCASLSGFSAGARAAQGCK